MSQEELRRIGAQIGLAWATGFAAGREQKDDLTHEQMLDRIEGIVILAMADLGYPVSLNA